MRSCDRYTYENIICLLILYSIKNSFLYSFFAIDRKETIYFYSVQIR